MTDILNSCIQNVVCPSELKHADLTPIFWSVDSTAKKNCRPISINLVSKLFEKLIQSQLNPFSIKSYAITYVVTERAKYALQNLIESWKKFRDRKGYSAALLMDLSKAFGTINHELFKTACIRGKRTLT